MPFKQRFGSTEFGKYLFVTHYQKLDFGFGGPIGGFARGCNLEQNRIFDA
jgi:hypothetical protein